MNATLTAVPGFRVGHWTDPVGRTGCTALLCPPGGAVASASFLGPSPGTREGVLLAPEKQVERVHALLFAGGSAFGLAAATGVMRVLEEAGVGVDTLGGRVPIVPAAVIYDLGVGSAQARPGEREGELAARAASAGAVVRGRVGAGTGATVGKYLGPERATPGGLGSAYLERGGVAVGALAVVNPVGDVVDGTGQVLAGPGVGPGRGSAQLRSGEHTTLVAVATAHALSKSECRRLADAAQTALARVIRPSHTPWDGDSAFVLSSGEAPAADPLLLSALVQDAVCAAILDAIQSASDE